MAEASWRHIWIAPRKTIAELARSRDRSRALMCGLGAVEGLSRISSPEELHLPLLVLVRLVFGILVAGLLRLWLEPRVVRWVGAKMGGGATLAELRGALAWSSFPIVISLPLVVLELAILAEVPGKLGVWALLVLSLVELLLHIQSAVIYWLAVDELEGFRSVWKAILAVLPAWVVFVACVFVSGLMVGLMGAVVLNGEIAM